MSGKENRMLDFLGGAGWEETSESAGPLQVIELVRKGIPRSAFDVFSNKSSLSRSRISSIIHISDRSIQRRKKDQRLSVNSSEKLVELARLFALGEEVFENLDLFKKWIEAPSIALGGYKPIDMLDTSLGFDMVRAELLRIEHGVYS